MVSKERKNNSEKQFNLFVRTNIHYFINSFSFFSFWLKTCQSFIHSIFHIFTYALEVRLTEKPILLFSIYSPMHWRCVLLKSLYYYFPYIHLCIGGASYWKVYITIFHIFTYALEVRLTEKSILLFSIYSPMHWRCVLLKSLYYYFPYIHLCIGGASYWKVYITIFHIFTYALEVRLTEKSILLFSMYSPMHWRCVLLKSLYYYFPCIHLCIGGASYWKVYTTIFHIFTYALEVRLTEKSILLF